MMTLYNDVGALHKTFDRIDSVSRELSKGLRDKNFIQHNVELIEETSTVKAQINAIRAKNETLGYLIDIMR